MLGRPCRIQVCPWKVSGGEIAARRRIQAGVCEGYSTCLLQNTPLHSMTDHYVPQEGSEGWSAVLFASVPNHTHVRAVEDDQAAVYAPAGCTLSRLLACTCMLPAAVPTLPNLPASVGLQANSVF